MTTSARQMLVRLFMLLGLMGSASSAQALCLPALCSCSTVTTNLAFGSYSPLAFGSTDSSATVKVSCGGVAGLLIPFKIDFNVGNGSSYTNRRLTSGAYTLSYNLYTDASYTTIWGDGTGSSQTVPGSVTLDVLGLSPAQTFWVYGRLPGRQLTAAPGVYSDTISVTLTYY